MGLIKILCMWLTRKDCRKLPAFMYLVVVGAMAGSKLYMSARPITFAVEYGDTERICL
jgi:hypothetical protein